MFFFPRSPKNFHLSLSRCSMECRRVYVVLYKFFITLHIDFYIIKKNGKSWRQKSVYLHSLAAVESFSFALFMQSPGVSINIDFSAVQSNYRKKGNNGLLTLTGTNNFSLCSFEGQTAHRKKTKRVQILVSLHEIHVFITNKLKLGARLLAISSIRCFCVTANRCVYV